MQTLCLPNVSFAKKNDSFLRVVGKSIGKKGKRERNFFLVIRMNSVCFAVFPNLFRSEIE